MNKKIIVAIFCVSIMLIGALPASSISIPETIEKNCSKSHILEKAKEILEENLTLPSNFVITFGPITKSITDLEILDGAENEKAKIEKLMNRKFVLFSKVLPAYVVPVFGMNFTIEYKKDVRNGSRFTYSTSNGSVIFDESGNPIDMTNFSYIRNTIHKIKVENFTGLFMFMHGKFIRGLIGRGHWFLIPALGSFAGYCDKITYLK